MPKHAKQDITKWPFQTSMSVWWCECTQEKHLSEKKCSIIPMNERAAYPEEPTQRWHLTSAVTDEQVPTSTQQGKDISGTGSNVSLQSTQSGT